MSAHVIIMGAAGRDFHNFNVFFRNNPVYHVDAFTATQIPDIDGRRYPAELAGDLYPDGIPIVAEAQLTELIEKNKVDFVVFAYSDVSYDHIMHKASEVQAAGASFMLLGPKHTEVRSKKPLISICAVRTGCGKSQTTRRVSDILRAAGKKVVAIRHPMPYGDLVKQAVQRFATYADLDYHKCTIEEREEYEPHIDNGVIVYAGVDYEAILRQAEKEADVILWDGGNNDMSFYRSDLHIVVADPHRAGHEERYYPGESNIRSADVVVINKMDTARPEDVAQLKANLARLCPEATVIDADSPLTVDHPEMIEGKKALVVEDGPTLTHGEMTFGAGVVAARQFKAAEMVDPRPYTVDSITATYKKYPRIGVLLPAMGYSEKQVRDLETTINATPCDVVISATPIDITRLVKVNKPLVRVQYSLAERPGMSLETVLKPFIT